MNKMGSYISKLMVTIVDKEQEPFVKELALDELKRLNVNMEEFIRKHTKDMFEKMKERQLLQEQKKSEDKKNVKDK
tara:strand:- start:234 stop:461 length:228 start_codon:yes stop_codon:yes gene_type:complete